ncbi:MAG: nucleotidyl transferase AbiEii/AbiGii toxin family protein [Candidatus Micrarchaeota archaeon]|nr:nucleotidyl transferase AbiEii/AbiGii toxin family protein [Candidatus Micrarchaeota archaeon]
MELPIAGMLSGQRLEVAKFQDTIIDIVYNQVQPEAVLYGGTAIWRCYDGGRFSEDIDIYVGKGFRKKLEDALPRYGIKVTWRDSELPLHMRLSNGTTEMLLEASLGEPEGKISQYARVDGSTTTVFALTPEELVIRKMEAYAGRRYARDLYDIFHMTNYIAKKDYYVRPKLRAFLSDVQRPKDFGVLKSLIYKGDAGVSFDSIMEYLKEWSE